MAGNLNIADWVTRRKSLTELGPRSAWQRGPDFLRQPVEEWPVSSHANVEELLECHKAIMNVRQWSKRHWQLESTSEGSVRLSY